MHELTVGLYNAIVNFVYFAQFCSFRFVREISLILGARRIPYRLSLSYPFDPKIVPTPLNLQRASIVKDSWDRSVGDILLHGNPWSFEGKHEATRAAAYTRLVGIERARLRASGFTRTIETLFPSRKKATLDISSADRREFVTFKQRRCFIVVGGPFVKSSPVFH